MRTRAERLERDIAREKETLADNLTALEVRARELTDWRWQTRQRPLAAVGVALLGGLALAMVAGPRRPRVRRHAANGDDATEPSLPTHPIVDRFVAALAVVAVEKAVAVLGKMMPELQDVLATEPVGPSDAPSHAPRGRGEAGP